jgi:FkbM family methyltransferase
MDFLPLRLDTPAGITHCQRHGLRTRTIQDPVGFALLIDADADDPISRAYLEDVSCASRLKQSLKRLLSWPIPSRVPHLELLRRLLRPGDRVLDLGAHIGTVSLAAAALGCEVVAVEPCPCNAALLRASAAFNSFGRLLVVEAAVGDRPGIVSFSPLGPFGHLATPATNLPSIPVRSVRVDDLQESLGWDRLNLIKMDIEGSEIAALRGMNRLLSRPDAPPILYESNSHVLGFYGHTPRHLQRALADFGYRSYRADAERLVPLRPDAEQSAIVTDYLAIKRLSRRVCHEDALATSDCLDDKQHDRDRLHAGHSDPIAYARASGPSR